MTILSKKIEFEFQIETIIKDENIVTYNIKPYERELIIKEVERDVLISSSYSTSSNINIIVIINDIEYIVKGKFFRKYTSKNI